MLSGYRDCYYRDVPLFLFHEEDISLAYDDWLVMGAGNVQDWTRMLGFHRKSLIMAETRILGLGHIGNDHSHFLDYRMSWLK